jgi:DnaJ family protein C protein 28
VNGLVRKYNAMAPYAVRKPYYTRDAELARSYGECAEDILGGIQERLNTSPAEIKDGQDMPSRRDPGTDEAVAPNTMIESTWRIVDVIRRWLAKLRG